MKKLLVLLFTANFLFVCADDETNEPSGEQCGTQTCLSTQVCHKTTASGAFGSLSSTTYHCEDK